MLDIWIVVFGLLSGGQALMIHSTQNSLCLEHSAATAEVLLKKCNLYSMYQQWIWIPGGRLMCVATSRCLSAHLTEPVQTLFCQGHEDDRASLLWDCDRDILISRNTSMILSVNNHRVILTHNSKQSKWKSLEEGGICQKRFRLRRASDDPDESQNVEDPTGEVSAMTEEQRQYLRWFYRTEDGTTWKFVLLGLAFVCLLIGFLLLGMGSMANKNRKKVAQYKAAASLVKKSGDEELQTVLPLQDNCSNKPPPAITSSSLDRLWEGNAEVSKLKAGNIVVTWKDGNTSCVYSDPAPQEDEPEDKPEEDQVEEKVEASAAELLSHDEIKMTE